MRLRRKADRPRRNRSVIIGDGVYRVATRGPSRESSEGRADLLAKVEHLSESNRVLSGICESRDHWRDRAAAAESRIAAVLALHQKMPEAHRNGYEFYCNHCITAPDMGDYVPWPCPTVAALQGHS